jgi:hypothetical protein
LKDLVDLSGKKEKEPGRADRFTVYSRPTPAVVHGDAAPPLAAVVGMLLARVGTLDDGVHLHGTIALRYG